MRWALTGSSAAHYPEWAICLDMAQGDPLRAKEIYEKLDRRWFMRWAVWIKEKRDAKIPDLVVGMYAKE
jgi:hypothetical protein